MKSRGLPRMCCGLAKVASFLAMAPWSPRATFVVAGAKCTKTEDLDQRCPAFYFSNTKHSPKDTRS